MSHSTPRTALELFCGIGGCAAALRGLAEVRLAIDISQPALQTYRLNHDHPTYCGTLESHPVECLRGVGADLWWLSPPCQPYTQRGRQRDSEDPRAQPLLRLLDAIRQVRPPLIALENVPAFAGSDSERRLLDTLHQSQYRVSRTELCPTTLGIPNRRRRYYLVASRVRGNEFVEVVSPGPCPRVPLATYLDPAPADGLYLPSSFLERYGVAGRRDAQHPSPLHPSPLHIIAADDPDAVTNCFTAGYGHSHLRSGSYLRDERGVRRFSPDEVLRLLGFPRAFRWPEQLSLRQRYRLAGNSLSLPVVRHVVTSLLGSAGRLPTTRTNSSASRDDQSSSLI